MQELSLLTNIYRDFFPFQSIFTVPRTMFCLILISQALNHLLVFAVGGKGRNHLLLTEYKDQQSEDFTLRTLHLFH